MPIMFIGIFMSCKVIGPTFVMVPILAKVGPIACVTNLSGAYIILLAIPADTIMLNQWWFNVGPTS